MATTTPTIELRFEQGMLRLLAADGSIDSRPAQPGLTSAARSACAPTAGATSASPSPSSPASRSPVPTSAPFSTCRERFSPTATATGPRTRLCATPGPTARQRRHAGARGIGGFQAFLDKRRGPVAVASAEVFLGRRRETQRILRGFGSGPERAGAVIHSIGRLGKSPRPRLPQAAAIMVPLLLFGVLSTRGLSRWLAR